MVPELRDVRKGKSFFRFINDFFMSAETEPVNPALHRLCSMMRKMGVASSIVEELSDEDEIIVEEVGALCNFFGVKIDIKAYRITFLSEFLESISDVAGITDDKFLSSSVVINYLNPSENAWTNYIFRSVVVVPKVPSRFGPIPLLNNFVHVYKVHDCEVFYDVGAKKEFKITGSFFCQQNSYTSVCAHASLCMTINNMDGMNEITPEDINKIIGVDHTKGKRIGLSKEEILDVLKQSKLTFEIRDYFSTNHEEDYNNFVYKYIEGRFPCLLVFTTKVGEVSHIVPVLGHTLNTDMWRPEAEVNYSDTPANRVSSATPASAYVDHLIIHDDNFGMYFCLPVDSLKKIVLPQYDPEFRIFYAIAIVPDGVTTPAWEAEWASVVVSKWLLNLRKEVDDAHALDEWCGRLASMARPWVVRTFLVKKEYYSKSLEEEDFEGNKYTQQEKERILNNLPDIFWLAEITLPDLYTANRSKIIDVYYPADCEPLGEKNKEIFQRWIQVRAPYALIIRNDDKLNLVELSIKSHVQLFHFSTTIETLEW